MASLRERPGTSFWTACFTDSDGKKIQRSTGTRDRREAQKIADAFEAASQRKFTVAHVQRTLRELMADATGTPMPGSTVREYFLAFVARKRVEAARSTAAFYHYNVTKFLQWCAAELPLGGGTQLAAIQPSHVDAYRLMRIAEVSTATVNHSMKCIKQIFDAAKREGFLLDSPCSMIGKIRRHEVAEIRPFTVDEVKLLLSKAEDEWRSMILFGFYTGQRLGDISRLEWKHVNLDRCEVSFLTSKTQRRMVIPLAVPLVARLASVSALDRLGPVHPHAARVVASTGKVGHLSVEFKKLLASCGLVAYEADTTHRKKAAPAASSSRRPRPEISFHSFRHTATSMLRDSGAPQGVAMELIGHASATVHRHYAHLGADTLRRAVSLLPTL